MAKIRVWVAGFAVLAALAGPAVAQTKDGLSDKSVKTLMEYAWQILPNKFTTPTGKVIEVDKKKRDAAIVPVDVGHEVIRVAYNSAQAQICELWEDQAANFDALMRREIRKKKWSDQQLLYITTLHRMTIHAAAGKLRVEDKDGVHKVYLEPIVPGPDTCTKDKKDKVHAAILSYVNADLPSGRKYGLPPPEGAAPVAAPAAPAAAPAATPTKGEPAKGAAAEKKK